MHDANKEGCNIFYKVGGSKSSLNGYFNIETKNKYYSCVECKSGYTLKTLSLS